MQIIRKIMKLHYLYWAAVHIYFNVSSLFKSRNDIFVYYQNKIFFFLNFNFSPLYFLHESIGTSITQQNKGKEKLVSFNRFTVIVWVPLYLLCVWPSSLSGKIISVQWSKRIRKSCFPFFSSFNLIRMLVKVCSQKFSLLWICSVFLRERKY